MLIDELPTPVLLIEHRRLERNLARMQEKADVNGVSLRPHTKTHKSTAVAQRQIARGAKSITVAKVGEAEIFVEAGIDDVRIAYPIVGRDKLERIDRLMERARISFCVDTEGGARAASEYFEALGKKVPVLIEVDTGHGRSGVPWDRRESIDFGIHVAEMPGLTLIGILTHAGQSYQGPRERESTLEALHRVAADERDRMLQFASRLKGAGLPVDGLFEISAGSTPAMAAFENKNLEGLRITEIRPGNYVFNDAMQVALGSASLDECALTVLTTVVSKHRDRTGAERLFLDAGKKVFTSDTGYGTKGFGVILYNAAHMLPLPHAHISNLSEEHGWVQVFGGATLGVGDRVRVVPNHACVTVNLQDVLYLVDGQDVLDTLTVDARGKVI